MTRQRAVLVLATLALLGGPTLAPAQATFGNPVAVEGTDEFGFKSPTGQELFRVDSEPALKVRLRTELRKVKKVDFPEDAPLLRGVPSADLAPFPEQIVSSIGGQVCYRPLYFEDKRTERFGQYVPCVQPLLSAGRFYADVFLLPIHMPLTPPWTFECDNR